MVEQDNGSDRDAMVEAAARANAVDLSLTARLAPRAARRDLMALAAFVGETARVLATARESLVGEIRLQWWRDALDPSRLGGEATGSPIVDALRATIARHALPAEPFAVLLDARLRALDAEFCVAGTGLDQYFDDTDAAAFRLAARILGVPEDDAAAKLLGAAGQAYGRIQLLRALPFVHAARSHLLHAPLINDWAALAPILCEDARGWLRAARLQLRDAGAAIPAVLPLALVEPYLAALERLGPEVVRERADISPLTRVWRLWLASVRGKI